MPFHDEIRTNDFYSIVVNLYKKLLKIIILTDIVI